MKFKILSFLVVFIFIGCAKNINVLPIQEINEPQNERIRLIDFELSQTINSLPFSGLNVSFDEKELLERRFKVFTLKGIKQSSKELFWAFDVYKPSKTKTYYGSNFRPIPLKWFEVQKKNANFTALNSIQIYALTTANTALRNFPTDEPMFYNPSNPGEGYPFDYLQLSTLSIGYPVFVSHLSLDRAWAFVSDDTTWGWLKVEDIKFISDETANKYAKQKFLTIKVDKTPIYSENGAFLFYARIGALLPFESENTSEFVGQIYTRAGLVRYKASKQVATHFPMMLNDENVKFLSQSLLGQPYGWGGVDRLRDCSLFLKDFMASFGVWLPRNSGIQANVGTKINLKGLSNDEKKRIIKERGVPYLTLIHLPGHIMLYAGYKDDEIYVMHDAWGIKTTDNGRALIGQTAITTLEIGKGRVDVNDESLLISKIDSINILRDIEPFKISSVKSKQSEPLSIDIKTANINLDPRIIALQDAYSVKIVDNKVFFDDGTSIKFDDFMPKDSKCSTEADVQDMNALPYAAFMPLNAPLSDSGRCRNYEFLSKIYGSSESEVKANLKDVVWLKDTLNLKLKFNSQNGAADALQAVSDELNELVKNDPKMLEYLKNPGGTFKWRVIAGTSQLSAHSYAIAVDINVDKSHYWRWHNGYKNLIPESIVHIFERHKFIWGGRWEHFDTMHFEYRPEMFGVKQTVW
ncbi:SH3 domain-containing protein [Campylobacter sp. faydin G-105]|uniref:bifunctional C40 family peptidase/M15 family metallopeptidase n=1 Tax=Campylobacter anatolicus TaxID=2829105 RepID=UPI001B982805|nr:SH3 domain-containing protein [Campylobacter anatolicus]MBR8462708.1 SH3 domain-containing protein [Campylobacter anatolicus]